MRPVIALDETVLRQNAAAWRRYAGVPLRAVIKANAYGWGVQSVVGALEDVVDGFCVADADEFLDVRKCTSAPIIIFSDVSVDRLGGIIAAGGIPTIDTLPSLEFCIEVSRRLATPLKIRLGIMQAFGWNGITLGQLPAYAAKLYNNRLEVELWTHLTDENAWREQTGLLARAGFVLGEAGVKIAGSEVASTVPLALHGAMGTSVRVGIGLFGATFGQEVPGIRCALCVKAPIVQCAPSRGDMLVGYGGGFAPDWGYVILARCGYSDGLPRALAGSADILSIGMQYVTLHSGREKAVGTDIMLVDQTTNLDDLAARARMSPHEVVTAFGNARMRSSVEG